MHISHRGTAYDLVGPEDAPTVVLIHGIGLTRRIWDSYVPILAQRFRVLIYDLCGHGESGLPERVPDLTVLSEQLRELLDELHIHQCACVGFSLGGMINRRFAMDHPDRVSALVILNSPHERSLEGQRLVEKRAATTAVEGIGATINTTLERWFTPTFMQKTPSVVAWVRETLLANDIVNFAQHRQVLASGVTELIRPLPAIAAPTLVITCENDTGSTPEMSHAIAVEIPGARAVIIPNLQHLGLLEEPEMFSDQILKFLDSLPGCWEITKTER